MRTLFIFEKKACTKEFPISKKVELREAIFHCHILKLVHVVAFLRRLRLLLLIYLFFEPGKELHVCDRTK